MGRKAKINPRKFSLAVKDSRGIKAIIAKRLDCTRMTVYKYVKEHPEAQKMLDDECEVILDMAETVIFNSIQNNDVKVAQWYLTQKGASRGYGNLPELRGEGDTVSDDNMIDVSTREVIDRIKNDSLMNAPRPANVKKIAPMKYEQD